MIKTLVTLALVAAALGEVRFSLDASYRDAVWNVTNEDQSIHVKGSVPGGIYTDLQAAAVLNQSIFYRFNDIDYRWVSRDNWTYSRFFDLPAEILQKQVINLVFHGIDTVAEVFLNGQSLEKVDNMFVRYVFPVKNIVKESGNLLEVAIESSINAAKNIADALPYDVPPPCVDKAFKGECHANLLRKMQASFSWDWGPAFPSAGLWKSVEVEGMDVGVIRDVTVVTKKIQVENITSWLLNVTVYADLATEHFDGFILGVLVHEHTKIITPTTTLGYVLSNENYSYVGAQEYIFEESEINVWWPNGFGEQQLYQLNVSLVSNSVSDEVAKSIEVGFRTIELVQEQIMEAAEGLSFYFKVNGVPIFMKGSNWIPGHVLPELGADESMLKHTLLSAKEANMNMLRVWGGGVYESDLFYKLADEYGILIWQDMMFACSMYPTGEDYLNSVRVEIEQQIRRLQHHPSVAVWAGNNENEAALVGNWYGTTTDYEKYKADYIKLYVDVVRPVVKANDETRSYVVSSPSNGVNSEDQGFVASDPYSALYGDVHYYNYVSDGWNSFTFPETRFASEYGYQGMPSFESIKTVSRAEDWKLTSNFSDSRQHHPGGNLEMVHLITQHLPLSDDDSSLDFYQRFIYFSQISQGMSTKTETEKYRRARSQLSSSNRGRTMGALYWQLNDVWQAPTWASIEFSGRWKLLHYLAKKFFAPVLISPEITPDGEINVYLVSDLLEDVSDLTVNISVISYDSFEPKSTVTVPATLVNASSQLIHTDTIENVMHISGNCTNESCFLFFSLNNGTATISENYHFLANFNSVALPDAHVAVSITAMSDTSAILEVTADSVAPFVWLETELIGVFSDNGFLLTSAKRKIFFETRGEILNATVFQDSLTVRDLTNTVPKKAIVPKSAFIEVVVV